MRRAMTLRIEGCGTRLSPGATNTGCGPAGGAALGDGAAAGAASGLAPSTSALTIRPFGPLPLMRERSSPFSVAMRLASGDAKIRPPLGACAGFGAAAGGAVGEGAAGFGADAGTAAAGADFGAIGGAGSAPGGQAGSPPPRRK